MDTEINPKQVDKKLLERYCIKSLDDILSEFEQAYMSANDLTKDDYFAHKKEIKKGADRYYYITSASSFSVDVNPVMQNFIRNDVINEQRHKMSKTYILIDKELSDNNWAGFFTIRMDVLDISLLENSKKKKLLLTGKSPKNIEAIPYILIEEISKNSQIINNKINMDIILTKCMNLIISVQDTVGGKIVVLNSINVDKIKNKYHNFGFHDFSDPEPSKQNRDVLYQPMFFDMDTIRE